MVDLSINEYLSSDNPKADQIFLLYLYMYGKLYK